jgi:protein-arginine kinase
MPEFLNCASALRLGIDTGLFTGVSVRDLNAATLAVMPAHLQKFAKRELDGNALSVLRADRVCAMLCKKRALPQARVSEKK